VEPAIAVDPDVVGRVGKVVRPGPDRLCADFTCQVYPENSTVRGASFSPTGAWHAQCHQSEGGGSQKHLCDVRCRFRTEHG
jgi:hypothetical protein